MAIQNATQRIHYGSIAPTTIMTGNTTQLALDVIDLIPGVDVLTGNAVRTRFSKIMRSMLCFAPRCAVADIPFLLGQALVPGATGSGWRNNRDAE
jgi:uncharacterized membrane protein YoaK (UPF0700 family)